MLGLLFPSACDVCGRAGESPCAVCAAGLVPAAPGAVPAGLERCAVLLAYEGVGAELVAALKFRNRRAALPRLAVAMAALVDPVDVDVVTWAPTSSSRRRRRGYDQAELLARGMGRALHRPCRATLRRSAGPPQTGQDASARRVGPAFTPRRSVTGAVLVVDDVVTTGSTLSAAAGALRRAGATAVSAVILARTPLKVVDGPVENETGASKAAAL